jgi:uncharacterized protein YjbJ (UPF0337 family)
MDFSDDSSLFQPLAQGLRSGPPRIVYEEVAPMAGGTGDKIEGKMDELQGNVKQRVGDVTDDRSMQAEGLADEAKGQGQGVLGEAKDAANTAADAIREKTR